jgi:hypothetical protein
MDFRNRMSQQFRPHTVSNGGRVKQQQNDSDAFMRLVRMRPLLFPIDRGGY